MAQGQTRRRRRSLPRRRIDRDHHLDRDDRRHLVHGFISPAVARDEGTLRLVRGRGIYVWDSEGNRYIDGLASLWNVHVGHGRAEIARAAAEQMKRLAFAPTLLGFSSAPAIELAARLASWAPKGMGRVFFTSGGSEANESVIRLCRLYWRLRGRDRKHKIVALERAYHGSSMGSASLTGLSSFHRHYEPLLPGVVRIPNAYCYRCPLGLTYPQCGTACAGELEKAIEREGADTVAAFIAEPVQGVGGVIEPPPGYFQRLRQVCDRHEVLLIADEVITGFGRLGTAFGITRWKTAPDMIVFAKGVTSGYLPLGGVILRDDLYRVLEQAGPGFALHHGFTYSGHPAVCAAALVNLEILEREGLLAHVRRLAPYFARRLGELRALAAVGDVRAAGLMGAVELVADRARKTPFAAELAMSWRVRAAALRRGVIVRGSGDNVVVCPPLIVRREELDVIVDTLAESIREASAQL
jgi:adenosylmethionine-8-amino-7-oxononanoate aminotransferase